MKDKVHIAILGTRGIPNNYGGFEQCAAKISCCFVERGHDVTVYNPRTHPYSKKEWNGVRIKRIFSNENRFKFLDNFIFDYLCLKNAVKSDFDIILQLGYSPSSLYYYLWQKTRAKIVTNMDGLEWKRSKWNGIAKKILIYSEKLAVRKSDALIADNPNIKDYLLKKHGVDSFYIPYGADLHENPKEAYLKEYGLDKYSYYMLVARLEPENNCDTIFDGYILSNAKEPFIIVGDHTTKYGEYLKSKYNGDSKIQFVGGIYDYDALSSLRRYAKFYFHGHSVGGTNPSLLEAMASKAYIVCHNNPFNRHILGEDGFYFSCAEETCQVINSCREEHREQFAHKNRDKIEDIYNWDKVADQYLKVFAKVLKRDDRGL